MTKPEKPAEINPDWLVEVRDDRPGLRIPKPPVPRPRREPKAMIQRTGHRETGFQAWKAWVENGYVYDWSPRAGNWITRYAWTEERARRKALRMLAQYRRENSPGPETEVEEPS